MYIVQLKKGFAHLIPIFIILALAVAGAYYIYTKVLNKRLSLPGSGEPTVQLKKDYKNPFDKKTQYVNPFDEYKSPLHSLQ